MGELVGRLVAQTAVGPFAVVFVLPDIDFLSGVLQVAKPVGVQALVAQLAIETLHSARSTWDGRAESDQVYLPLLAPAEKWRLVSSGPLSQRIESRRSSIIVG